MLVADDDDDDDDDDTVAYRPVTRQRLRNKQRDNSRCYEMVVIWAVILDPFLGNESLNTFPQQPLCVLRGKRCVV
jgi:hypothetical protein